MSDKLIYVRRKQQRLDDTSWGNFCKLQDRSKAEVYSATILRSNQNIIQMTDKPQNSPWTFQITNFDIVNDFPVYKPLDNGVDEKHTVFRPKHYEILDKPTIEMLACSMTPNEWRGFCMGNILKYRLRAGKKDSLEQDIGKANEYETIYEQYKHLCREE